MSRIQELKATRDIYVHNGGFVNALYNSKAGIYARKPEQDGKLPMDPEYILSSVASMREFIVSFHNNIPEKIKNYRKANAFKEMWNATILAKLVSFEDAWAIEGNGNMVRPVDDNLNRYWSHSEKPLVDFFLGIYASHYHLRETDVLEAMRKWPPSTNEGKVMISWMDSPFWF